MNIKTGILLIQLGTPNSPQVKDVRVYLREFLSDPRVIDISTIPRFFLVNFIIAPFRAPKSAKIYQKLWTENGLSDGRQGSPLLLYSESVKRKLQNALGNNFEVELAMRYQNPSMDSVLEKMRKKNYKKIIIFPLFPQYASASSGSAIDKALEIISKWWVIPEVKTITEFWDDEGYLNAFYERGKRYNLSNYDHVLFSYHGLPERQINKVHPERNCAACDCSHNFKVDYKYCYKAECYQTTRLLAQRLNISSEKYTVCFQSRLDEKWLRPFTDKTIIELAKKGIKKILVFSPAFVSDCLETIIEVGDEYQKLFKDNGGEKIQLVESLNDHPLWIETLKEIILKDN
jgi:protoporphyrin/coproporphyrin ferrochelatase